MSRRMAGRAVATLVAAVLGAVLLSGSDQPVTAHAYARWQEVAAPPFSPRTHALGVRVGSRVLVLGGRADDGSVLRDGAAYELHSGRWQPLAVPFAVTDDTPAVSAGGAVVVRAGAGTWWRYDVRPGVWSRMSGLPIGVSAPSSFGSEVYALAGGRVVVYSVQLDRWTPLPPDRLRPRLTGGAVAASRAGTVVTGYAGPSHRRVADRWDGLHWHRTRARAALPVRAPGDGATRIEVDGRIFLVRGGRAWIRLR